MSLDIKNVSKSFDKKDVLNDISFSINKGEIVALIGRNGSGKTTSLEILSGILNADHGDIILEGKSIEKNPEVRAELAYLPDRFDYFKFSNPKDIVKYYELIYPRFDKDFYFSQLEKLGIDSKDNIRNLSKGNLALLGLVTILATGANYLLLDEVLDGIDIINKRYIIEYLLDAVEKNRAILVCSHQIAELEGIADRGLYITMEGKLEEASILDEKMHKYQIVTEEVIEADQAVGFKISGNIARVYTIMSKYTIDEIIEKNPAIKIVQYDELEFKYEDIFQMEKEGDLK